MIFVFSDDVFQNMIHLLTIIIFTEKTLKGAVTVTSNHDGGK